jgi:hypothetical protein
VHLEDLKDPEDPADPVRLEDLKGLENPADLVRLEDPKDPEGPADLVPPEDLRDLLVLEELEELDLRAVSGACRKDYKGYPELPPPRLLVLPRLALKTN